MWLRGLQHLDPEVDDAVVRNGDQPMLDLTQLSNYLTLKGSFSAGWLAGRPDYLQKLKVLEGYEKVNDYSNIRHMTADGRSRLYRSQILQVNMRLKALAKIYTMHSFAPLKSIFC